MQVDENPVIAETARSHDGPIETDAVIVGAGPVGLFQVFELGLLEIKAHIIDSLAYPGGQCIELYPDKPIYDIPAVPMCTGKELTDNLLKQIEPFGATFHLGQEVTQLARRDDGRFDVATSKGTRFVTRTVFIAGGVGSFQPRTLRVDGIDKFLDTQLFYRVRNPAQFAGKNLVIVGGGDSALDWTLNFVQEGPHKAESVILMHRRDDFRAAPASVAKMRELCEAYEMQFVVGQATGFEEEGGRLTRLKVTGSDGVTRVMPLDMLLVFFGLSPKLGPIADWGLGIDRKQLVVDTEKFETTVPGIFAVGDINIYPGKKKLILSGFHEAALAAFGAAPYVFPEKRILLQYTTTSPKLHKVLGVETPVFD
ncbi:MAG: NAD(P)/FAD-dependent oxidoreductase [Rubrivivax sp.]|mgnify:FL=1|nr:NAD(P)/FAD-dependent oxidoreductase [Betaproteobacteria bacterium]MBK8104719.1 NAD(P)/FAD-dependent oxidoreductase [Betaproteobacteria bacterium]MBL0295630.1 NAD(P)/FAD-dependent oxidoreductase [Betaproteobacteria bacterium]MBP6466321.1 NAD(P)/FAD-dependent oxidoreductase [Rubrivivax sp.]MBP9908047.1 NAD(P)/FAD-dependent oxidoreductase [Rubrivivax sp.]